MSDLKLVSNDEPTINNNYTRTVCSYTIKYELLTIEADKINRLWDNDVILEITDANVCIYQREVRSNIEMFSFPLSKNEIAILKKKEQSFFSKNKLSIAAVVASVALATGLATGLFTKPVEVVKPVHCEWTSGVNTDDYLCGKDLESELPEWKETDYRR